MELGQLSRPSLLFSPAFFDSCLGLFLFVYVLPLFSTTKIR